MNSEILKSLKVQY